MSLSIAVKPPAIAMQLARNLAASLCTLPKSAYRTPHAINVKPIVLLIILSIAFCILVVFYYVCMSVCINYMQS